MYRSTKRQFCETIRGNRVAPGWGGGHGGREGEREREREGQWKGARTGARVREKEGENGITEYKYARFFEGGSLESYVIYWVSCYNYFE